MSKLYKYLALVPSLGLVLLGGYTWYLNFKLQQCIAKPAVQAVRSIDQHDTIEQKVLRLPDPDLDERLDKWMRD